MSSNPSTNAHGTGGVDLAGVEVEPDNVPTRFLTIVAGALTAVVIAMVVAAILLFDMTKTSEYEAKGYSAGQVPGGESR